MRSLIFGDGREAVVVEGGGAGGFRNSPIDGACGRHITDASAQFPAQMERGENTAEFGEVRRGGIQRNLKLLQRGRNGIMRQAKQLGALLLRELLAGEFLTGCRVDCGVAGFSFFWL